MKGATSGLGSIASFWLCAEHFRSSSYNGHCQKLSACQKCQTRIHAPCYTLLPPVGTASPSPRVQRGRQQRAASLGQLSKLLLQTINSKRAELRVFFADLAKLDIFW